MFSITEQFSAATKSQLEAQLNLLNNYASKAVESAQKVLALNISTTKASVEKSSAAARRLLEAKDPQEFFSAGKAPDFDNLLAYSRELFSIASAAQAELIQSAKEQIQQAAPAAQAYTAKPPAPLAPAAKVSLAEVKKPAAAPVVAAAAPAPEAVAAPTVAPNVAPTPLPKAVAKAVAKAKPAAAATPIADAIVQLVEPPVPAKPAAAPVAAAAPKVAALKPAPKPVAAPKAAAKPPAVNFPTAKSVALKSVTPPAKTAPGKPQAKQLDMLGGGKGKK